MIKRSDGTKTVLLNGVEFVKDAYVKTEDGTLTTLDGAVLHGETSNRKAAPFVVATNEVKAFCCVDIIAPEGSVWDIMGTVTPVGSVVHLGDASKFDPMNPTEGEIAVVTSDDTGYFEFRNIEGFGTLNLWINVKPTMLGYQEANIEHEVTLVSVIESDVLKAYAGMANQEDWGGEAGENLNYLEITVSGECPEGATVYVSRGDENQFKKDLTASIVGQNSSNSTSTYSLRSTYSVTFQDEAWGGEYVAWCESAEGELTATLENVAECICLSGDTQITLADKSTKRLDELTDDDVLLSGEGKPTKIVKRKRGIFNSRHTLYTFEDGTVIDEVHAHRFFNVEQGFWQHLGKWKIGEHAKRQDGKTVALVSVVRMNERAEMFGLWTESHDYWANGLLSGETAANESLIADATAEQVADMVASLSEKWIDALSGLGGLIP